MANRHGLDEITAIAAATGSGLAKREMGVKPQMSARTINASATVPIFVVVLTAMPSLERFGFCAADFQRRSVVGQCDSSKGAAPGTLLPFGVDYRVAAVGGGSTVEGRCADDSYEYPA